MVTHAWIAGVLAAGLLTSGCASKLLTYHPPTEGIPTKTTVVVEGTFDETWVRLIELLAGSFGDIALLDRDSGFARLDLVGGDAAAYVNCGVVVNAPNPRGVPGHFSGDYATWLQEDGGFSGRIHITVREIADGRTQVRVHARYAVGSHVLETGTSNIRAEADHGTLDAGAARVCFPTYVAERNILRALSAVDREGE